MATEGSARVLGMDGHIGRIAPGYWADIVFLDAGHIDYVPLNDPQPDRVRRERRGGGRVMIGGRVVSRTAGRYGGQGARPRRAEAAAERLRAASAPARRAAEALEPALIGACQALAARPYPVERTFLGRA